MSNLKIALFVISGNHHREQRSSLKMNKKKTKTSELIEMNYCVNSLGKKC